MVGTTISHYKILEKLGEGGMGVVYKAEDTKLGRMVALKFLAPHLLRDGEARRRFEREARAAAALDHPNICTVHEIDECDGKTFIALAFIEGQTLTDKVSEGPMALNEALSVGSQLAEGLAAAHAQGVVHRDIKSDNVMLIKGSRGLVKIMDFGLARLSDSSNMTLEGTTLGTVSYMSPEQAEGGAVDHRSDLWSVGAVLYEMVAGRRPFRGDFDQAIVYSILNEQPDPLTAVRTGVPLELERIVGKCLSKDPGTRYQNAEDLRVDLENLNRERIQSGSRPAAPVTIAKATTPAKRAALAVVAALAVAGAGFWLGKGGGGPSSSSGGNQEIPSIAILPLVNTSGEPDFEYFSDGMTDELINALSGVEGLRVASRSSVFRFKGERYDIQEVASQLGVDNVLEGTVRRDGERLRITAQLISASDGFELWAGRFDREMESVFDIQDEVAAEMVKRLSAELSGEVENQPTNRPTESVEAYDLCLRGEFEQFKLDPPGVQKSIGYFEKAIELDSNFARAYAGLARSYTNLAVFGVKRVSEVADRTRELAARAVELDGNEARAHSAAAYVARMIDWDWDAAGASYRRALEINPADADTRGSYASFLVGMGRAEEGMAQSQRSLEQEPVSPSVNLRLTMQYSHAARFEDVIRQAQRSLELDPKSTTSLALMAGARVELGETEEGIKALEGLHDAVGRHNMGYYYGRVGRREDALAVANTLEDLRATRPVSCIRIAIIYAGLSDLDSVFKWLNLAVDEHQPGIELIASLHMFSETRADPRYQDLRFRIGFP